MKLKYLILILLLCFSPSVVCAQDKDDDLKPDNSEHIESSNSSQETSAQVEKQDPQAAKEIREFLKNHIAHANAKDIEAYMNDFNKDRIRNIDLLREYSERAMALKNLKIDQVSVEFAQIQARAATIHTRQISSYTNDKDELVVDDVILSYRLQKDNSNSWKILLTERRRLSAQ